MTQQILNIGSTPGDKTGDTLRVGGQKINANFAELYTTLAASTLPSKTGNAGKALYTDGSLLYWGVTGSVLTNGRYTVSLGSDGTFTFPGNLILSGSSSGSITLQAGTTPAIQTYTLPSAYPSGNNYVLASSTNGTLSWMVPTGSGSVTSVGLSLPSQFNITTSTVVTTGVLTAAWNTQTANYVLAGPTTGSAAAPTFRTLVAADIPSLSYVALNTTGQTITDTSSGTNYTLKIANGTTGAVFGIGTGNNAYGIANDALNNTISGYVPYTISASTITFKAGAVPATAISIASNGTVTIGTLAGLLKGTAGAISAAAASDINSTFGSQTQNYVYAAPSSGTGNPTFRALVSTDLPISGLQTRTTAVATTGSLAYQVSSTVTISVAKGYALYNIQTSVGAWVTIYTSSAAMTADGSRSITTDPTPGSGVVAESITTGASITNTNFSPAAIGYNIDAPVTTNLYLKVYNNSGATQSSITVTLTYLKLEV